MEHKELIITTDVTAVGAIAAILPWSDMLRPWLNRRGRLLDGHSNLVRHRRPVRFTAFRLLCRRPGKLTRIRLERVRILLHGLRNMGIGLLPTKDRGKERVPNGIHGLPAMMTLGPNSKPFCSIRRVSTQAGTKVPVKVITKTGTKVPAKVLTTRVITRVKDHNGVPTPGMIIGATIVPGRGPGKVPGINLRTTGKVVPTLGVKGGNPEIPLMQGRIGTVPPVVGMMMHGPEDHMIAGRRIKNHRKV